jgi:benzoyl-CoA reductase/2-hydroxyglutaryl-CoA dehydratase subunit BcrC/BadD/HgdB
VGETTCDAKKKTWDLFKFKVLEVPQKKNESDRKLWLKEVYHFKDMVENLSGVKITPQRLKESIKLMNRKRKALQELNQFRKRPNPPISGLDALLVAQVMLNQDTRSFIEDVEALIEELKLRVDQNISAYNGNGKAKRIMIAGTPSPMGNAKVHNIVESAGMHIVIDESCTGLRYFRDLVDETAQDLEGMIEAIADRYFKIDCSCYSPNNERMENIQQLVNEYKVQGIVQNVLQYCHCYNIESKMVENTLKELGIPSIKIETDYSQEDSGQIRTRIEAFSELLEEH